MDFTEKIIPLAVMAFKSIAHEAEHSILLLFPVFLFVFLCNVVFSVYSGVWNKEFKKK